MPRKYDKIIRYYSSWFDDFLDPSKEFTNDEIVQIFIAIRDAQVQMSLEPLENLPVSIRRALSMATMGEQVIRMIEKSESMRNRGAEGGNKTAQNRRTPEAIAAAQMRREAEEKKMAAEAAQREQNRMEAVRPEAYEEILRSAAHGDRVSLEQLRITQHQAIELCRKKGLPL